MSLDWYGEVTVCNETLGLAMCPNGQCYTMTKKCDGAEDCLDGYDEINCKLLIYFSHDIFVLTA